MAIKGRSKQYVRLGDAGSRITFNFCPACGATVHYVPAPAFSVYEGRKHAWVSLPEDIEHLA